jgi:hypothetical protein
MATSVRSIYRYRKSKLPLLGYPNKKKLQELVHQITLMNLAIMKEEAKRESC